jgi:hypothetical protein
MPCKLALNITEAYNLKWVINSHVYVVGTYLVFIHRSIRFMEVRSLNNQSTRINTGL